MKKNNLKLITVLLLWIILMKSNLAAQNLYDSITNKTIALFSESIALTDKKTDTTSALPKLNLLKLVKIDTDKLTSDETLDKFFTKKTSTYLSEASDLVLKKAYAVLDNSDDRIFLGGTFKANDTTLITIGFKANISKGFSQIFSGDGFDNDLGVNFNVTRLFRGSLWFPKKDDEPKIDTLAINRYIFANQAIFNYKKDTAEYKQYLIGIGDSSKLLYEHVEKNNKTLIEKFTDDEADYIDKKRLYNTTHLSWLSFDAYLPFTKSVYNVVPVLDTFNFTNTAYRPFTFNLVYTNFWDKTKWMEKTILPKGRSFLTFKASLIKNNSSLKKDIKSYSFDEYYRQDTTKGKLVAAKINSNTVYIGDFKEFWTFRLSARYVWMFSDFMGISASIEKFLFNDNLTDLNWKLGIPFSLKDKEAKSKVNFELVWQEIHKKHSIGLSVGLPFGGDIFK